ncbi:hypothetical protein [Heliorestis convoluta]|uniref:Uncharacterized protein n=1 Tax=Heliorestis convoluta TaxID=356322 RepID=A0A5Q2MYX8_9FIRM|nr:hypothetical protein [Heliorestis convoluta]QGG47867.1 hypothetical protein FTV88_1769 [Heliorestis convoluta]
MSKALWRWLLDMMPHDDLVSLARVMHVKVPGFRQIVLDHRIHLLRPRLIQTIINSKSFIKLQEAMDRHMQGQEPYLACREKDKEQLLELIYLGANPATLLSALISSPEQEHQEKAESLFIELRESEKLQSYEEQVAEKRKDDIEQKKILDTAEQWHKQYQEIEKKFIKLEEKIGKLNQSLEKQKNEFDIEKKQWHHEKQGFLLEIKEKDKRIKDKEDEIRRMTELCDTLHKNIAKYYFMEYKSPKSGGYGRSRDSYCSSDCNCYYNYN